MMESSYLLVFSGLIDSEIRARARACMAQVFDIDLDDDDHDSPAPSHVSKPFKTVRVSPSIWRSGRSSASGFLYDGPRPKPLKALPSALATVRCVRN